jgi:hypothetical protein
MSWNNLIKHFTLCVICARPAACLDWEEKEKQKSPAN